MNLNKIIKNKKGILIIILIVVVVILLFNSDFRFSSDDFTVDTFLLKSVIKQGEKVTSEVKITNTKHFEQNFQVSVQEIEDLVFLSEDSFKLSAGEEKKLEVAFEDKALKYEPGVYVGKIIVKAGSKEKEIPVVFEIQSQRILFATNLEVASNYKEISPGGKSVTQIKFFNLNDSRTHTVEVTYLIKNFDGEIFVLETEGVVVGSESTISKTIVLPENIPLGNYVFITITKYDDSTSTSSYIFSVKKKLIFFENVNFLVLVILIFLFAVMILVLYMIYERDKMFLQLRRQQIDELRISEGKIKHRRKLALLKIKKPVEKKRIIKRFKEIKRKIIGKIKEKHKEQRVVFKKLRKQKKKGEMKRKLEQWEREGINVDEFLTGISYSKSKAKKEDVKEEIRKLKKRGYDTGILTKK